MIDVEAVRRRLEERGLERTYLVKKSFDCSIILCKAQDLEFLACLYEGAHAKYARLVPTNLLDPSYWDCHTVNYVPNSLLVFASNDEELAERIVEKLPRLKRVALHGKR